MALGFTARAGQSHHSSTLVRGQQKTSTHSDTISRVRRRQVTVGMELSLLGLRAQHSGCVDLERWWEATRNEIQDDGGLYERMMVHRDVMTDVMGEPTFRARQVFGQRIPSPQLRRYHRPNSSP